MKFLLLSVGLLLGVSSQVIGQTPLVIVSSDSIPISFVEIFNPLERSLAYSNYLGEFTLNLKKMDSLILRHPNYEDKILSNFNELVTPIIMKRKSIQLDEIVVTAGMKKKVKYIEIAKGKKNPLNLTPSDNGSTILTRFSLKKGGHLDSYEISLNRKGHELIYYLKPLVYTTDKKDLLVLNNLIRNSHVLEISKNLDGVLEIDLSEHNVVIEKNRTYFIGFTLFSKSTETELNTWSICRQGNFSYLIGGTGWDKQELSCSLDLSLNITAR